MKINDQPIYVGTMLIVAHSSGMGRGYEVDELFETASLGIAYNEENALGIAYDEDGESLVFINNDQRVLHVDNSNCLQPGLAQISCLISSMIIKMAHKNEPNNKRSPVDRSTPA